MRVSTNPSDPGYAEYLRLRPLLVYLDDVKVDFCLMADDELGVVECAVPVPAGEYGTLAGEREAQTRTGRVQIIPHADGL